jgi:nitrogen regulatory protein PII
MKKLLSRLLAIAVIGSSFVLASCSDDDGDVDKKPSAPQATLEVSSLPIQMGESKSFTVNVSAAGKFKDITATADKGTVTVSEVTGVGQATGSAKINYTAPNEIGKGKITIVVNDQAEQQITREVSVDVTALPPVELAGGEVFGEWGPFRTYHVLGNLTIPAGKTLKVREGTTIIVDNETVRPSIVAIGNFYSYGTDENPVLFTIPEGQRDKAHIFSGAWGGIAATAASTEMVVLHTRIEYVGAPGVAGSDLVTSGEVKEGAPTYGLYFNNPNGKIVVMSSTIAYSVDVALQINQGSLLVANNTFILNGQTGGESVNLKSGAVGDIAYNVFYAPATNGVKWSNSGDRSPQNNANVYNNTVINGGWRQAKEGRGGSFNLEKAGRGKVYNNIVVNSKYGVRFPNAPDHPDLVNVTMGYNLYFGNNDLSVAGFYPSTGSVLKGDGQYETAHDIYGAINENDPLFANFDVSTFDEDAATDDASMDFPAAFDLHLKAGSPALNHGKTDFTTNFNTLSVGGQTYTVPTPSAFIGALGAQ